MDKVILIPHCMLNPSANVIFKVNIPKKLIDFLVEKDFNIIQMPCPELGFYSYGRSKKTRDMYDKEYRRVCRAYSDYLVKLILKLGVRSVYVLGIKYSPSCGISHVIVGSSWSMRRKSRGIGLFMQELREKMKKKDIEFKFIEYDPEKEDESFNKIKDVIENA